MVKVTIEDNVLLSFKPFLLGYCSCVCGGNIKNPFHGIKTRYKYILGHHCKGENNYWFKGGWKTTQGYIYTWKPDHPFAVQDGHVLEHRLVMEAHLGRYLEPWEEVHHINKIHDDNRIENLELVTHEEHVFIHHQGKRFTKIDTSDRFCVQCNSKTTSKNKTGSYMWYKNEEDGYICNKCYLNNLKLKKKKEQNSNSTILDFLH